MSLTKIFKCIALLTPTYQLYSLLKRRNRSKNIDSFELSKKIDIIFLLFSICLVLVHFVVEFFDLTCINSILILFYVFAGIQISRNIDIPFAFLGDVIDKLNPNSINNNNTSKRIELSVIVYLEVLLNYALIFSLIPFEYWRYDNGQKFQWCYNISNQTLTMFDSIYFSIVTIATLGYGDITPKEMLPKLLVMTEVMTSFVIVIMSIAVYISNIQNKSNASNP